MRVISITVLAIFAVAAFSATALAHRGGPGGFFGGPDGGFPGPALMMEHMADHLDLDDEQRETVRNIMEAARPEIQALREQLRANREALESLQEDDPAYSTALNDIAVSNGQLATEGTLLFTRVRSDVHAVLTDEQREKLARGKERMKKTFERKSRN